MSILAYVCSSSYTRNMKKLLIIALSVVGILTIAGGVVGALVYFSGNPQSTNETAEIIVPDKELGACDLLEKQIIATGLGDNVSAVADGQDAGYALDQSGEAQRCNYALNDNDDAFNLFSAGVTVFTSNEEKDASIARFETTTNVGGIGEFTFYNSANIEAGPDVTANNFYGLYVFNGQSLYSYELTVPSDGDTFTDETGRDALEIIAQSVDY